MTFDNPLGYLSLTIARESEPESLKQKTSINVDKQEYRLCEGGPICPEGTNKTK